MFQISFKMPLWLLAFIETENKTLFEMLEDRIYTRETPTQWKTEVGKIRHKPEPEGKNEGRMHKKSGIHL